MGYRGQKKGTSEKGEVHRTSKDNTRAKNARVLAFAALLAVATAESLGGTKTSGKKRTSGKKGESRDKESKRVSMPAAIPAVGLLTAALLVLGVSIYGIRQNSSASAVGQELTAYYSAEEEVSGQMPTGEGQTLPHTALSETQDAREKQTDAHNAAENYVTIAEEETPLALLALDEATEKEDAGNAKGARLFSGWSRALGLSQSGDAETAVVTVGSHAADEGGSTGIGSIGLSAGAAVTKAASKAAAFPLAAAAVPAAVLCPLVGAGCWVVISGKRKRREEPDHVHRWDSGTVLHRATCASGGTVVYKCGQCQNVRTERTAKDPANHAGGTETIHSLAATCIRAGYTGDVYCKGCGAKLSAGKAIPATGKHMFGEWEVTKPASAYTAGAIARKCATCQATQSALIPAEYVVGKIPTVTVETVAYGGGIYFFDGKTYRALSATIADGGSYKEAAYFADGVPIGKQRYTGSRAVCCLNPLYTRTKNVENVNANRAYRRICASYHDLLGSTAYYTKVGSNYYPVDCKEVLRTGTPQFAVYANGTFLGEAGAEENAPCTIAVIYTDSRKRQ